MYVCMCVWVSVCVCLICSRCNRSTMRRVCWEMLGTLNGVCGYVCERERERERERKSVYVRVCVCVCVCLICSRCNQSTMRRVCLGMLGTWTGVRVCVREQNKEMVREKEYVCM